MIKKILFILCMIPLCMQAQKTMLGTFSPAEDFKWFIIYQLKTTHQAYVDNGKIVDGKLNYTFKPAAEKGMYRLVYGMPQESENFDFIYSGEEDISFVFDEKSVEFTVSKENKLNTSYFSSVNTVKRGINEFYQSGEADEKAFLAIFKTLSETQEIFEKEAQGTIVENFIKASRSYTPTAYEAPEVMVDNIKKHYFDHVDFSNPVLQNSDFIADKMSNYVFTALPLKEFTGKELTEEYKKNIAAISEKIKPVAVDYQKSLFNVLWEQMVVLENDEIAIHIADMYLTPLANQLNDSILATKLETHKRLAFGAVAPEFTWVKDNKTHKLSELKGAENYIVVFWSSTCSHCLKELPLLKDFVASQEKDTFKVIAIGLEDERASWANESSFYPDFIHVLALKKWDNEIGNMYDVSSTPTFFVLDKDKRIIGKPYGVKELEEFFTKE
ncbi:TlpA family protein disulfide reductase [Kordia sp. YSTF-M3]|uniref:TlpA family protein disulfide reductase n=1 Tax=Kordia aestuariivivens TaxID=2759037 RepID=A0ABR7QAT3_9FLAO|nr:TlpA disulfide reductase family protein [Kordia aestuariivivens]MBC8755643.1 TlpA family protein disulfide reductase [Kordia aestuariivivens]